MHGRQRCSWNNVLASLRGFQKLPGAPAWVSLPTPKPATNGVKTTSARD
uniref:Uncharacterized protein n=1 Tax=Anguilla anguilla TaxID=7936 RepID=A0A0E9W964_ANGAN